MHSIENEAIRLSVRNYGAEMCSLISKKTGIEYIWQGNPQSWQWHAPICFPIVGTMPNNQYEVDGKKYTLTVHGFAREMDFLLEDKGQDKLRFHLSYDEATLAQYPYKFGLSIEYKLKGDTVEISYIVENFDHKEMYYSIGAHTAFRCPLADDKMTDYSILFDKNEILERSCVTGGFLNGRRETLAKSGQALQVSPELFAQDVLVFENLQSGALRLQNKITGRFIAVDFSEFPYLGIWTKPAGAPFICLEPWFGVLDDGRSKPLSEKKGICSLAPGNVFHCHHTVMVG